MGNFINTANHFFSSIPKQVIRLRWLVLSLTLLLSLFFLYGALTRTSINTAANSFLDKNDPAIVALDKYRTQFGSDDSVFLVYKAKDGDVFSKASLAAIQNLTNDLENWQQFQGQATFKQDSKIKLEDLQHIRRIQSLSNIRLQSADGDTLSSNRLIPKNLPDDPAQLAQLKTLALQQKDNLLAFYSPDARYAALLIQTDFGSQPSKDFVPKINDGDIVLDDSLVNASGSGITPNQDAEVQKISYEKVDNFLYARFVRALKSIYQRYDNQLEFYPVGYPPLMEFVQKVLQQSAVLNLGMILINIVLLWVLFRSFSAVLWPILTIALSIIWITGMAAWAGKSLSTMITLTIMLVFVCGLADCIHVLSLYQNRRREGIEHAEALRQTYEETGLPMFITGVTNMSGTLSLILSELYPIRVFAGMSTLGVGLALLFSLFLLPVLLDIWRPEPNTKQSGWGYQVSQKWTHLAGKTRLILLLLYSILLLATLGKGIGAFIAGLTLLTYVLSNWHQHILKALPKLTSRFTILILLVFGAIVALCWYGESKIRIDSNLTELTREGSEIRVAYAVADHNMAGTQNMEIMIDTKQSDGILNPAILSRIDQLQQVIEQKYPQQVSRTYSLANLVKNTNKIMHENQEQFYTIPDNQNLVSQLLYLFNSVNPSDRRSLVSDDYSQSHISVNVYSAGSSQYQTFFTEVQEEVNKIFGTTQSEFPKMEVTLTGTVPLAMRTQAIIAHSQYSGFLAALGVISVIIFLTLGSIQAGLISLIPNVIPALFTYGLMGLLDIPLDTDTLLLAPIIIGLAVDDTVHFMSHFRALLIKTQDMALALKQTIDDVGPSVLFTGMVLGLGFSIQSFSDYLGTAKMGIFGGLSIFVGILCELLLLPALLIVFKPKFGQPAVKTQFKY